MSMLTVYGRASSSNVQALVWGMEELGLDYTRRDYGETFAPLGTPEFLALHPHARIPVLVHDPHPPVFETGAILRYLASQFGDDTFWPRDPVLRAQVDMWAEWAKRHVAEGFTGPVFWRVVRTPASRRDPNAIAAALDRLHTELQVAEEQLATHAHIAGADFTLADILFGHVLYRYFDIDIPRPDLPALMDYYEGLTRRPAYRHAVMLNYDALRDPI